MADYRPLANSQVITFDLDEDLAADPGVLKSWGDGRRAKGNDDLRVEVQPQHQIHGVFSESEHEGDNASLLVFKFLPKPKNRDHKVLKLIIELRLLIPNADVDDEEFEENLPEIHSFEPAGSGEQFFGDRVTNVTKEKGGKISLTAPTPGPTIGGEASATTTSTFEWHERLTVKSDHEKTDSANKKDLVRWTVNAASPDQGIGDSFTVAVVITRQPGSQFCLTFSSLGLLGSWTGKIMKPFDFLKRKTNLPMGIYGPRHSGQKVPVGVLENNLGATLKNMVVLKTLKVGVHLPELVAPVTYYSEQATIIASTADTQSGLEKDTPQAQVPAAVNARRQTPGPAPATPPAVIPPPVLPSDVALGQARKVIDKPENGAPRPSVAPAELRREFSTSPAAASPCSCQNRPKSSSNWAQQVASRTEARRAERHRMMAALYERLARLHREEADEFLPPNEVAFIDDVVRPEMRF